MKFYLLTIFRVSILIIGISFSLTACASDEYGPLDGRVVDEKTGQPVAGAFVGVVWARNTFRSPPHPCVYTVLMQTDAQGRYSLPDLTAKIAEKSEDLNNIYWSIKLWAPGYLLLTGGSNALVHQRGDEDRVLGADYGKLSPEQREARLKTLPRWKANNMVVALRKAPTPLAALDRIDRPGPIDFHCSDDPNMLLKLAETLYKDSYHQTCESNLSPEAWTSWNLATVAGEFAKLSDMGGSTNLYAPGREKREKKLDRAAGWDYPRTPNNPPYPPLNAEHFKEYCYLMSNQTTYLETNHE